MKIIIFNQHEIEWEHNGKSYCYYTRENLGHIILEYANRKRITSGSYQDTSNGLDTFSFELELDDENIFDFKDIAEDWLLSFKYKWIAYSIQLQDSVYWTLLKQNSKFYLVTNGFIKEITQMEYDELFYIKGTI